MSLARHFRVVGHMAASGVALVALMVASGCSVAGEPGSRVLNREDITAEYDAAATELRLPAGFSFPGMPLDDAVDGYQEGCGLVAAQMYWQRAWQLEWLEQRGKDADRADAALAVLRSEVPTMDFMTKYADEGTRRLWLEYVQKAEMGDPSGIQQDVDTNPIEIERKNVE